MWQRLFVNNSMRFILEQRRIVTDPDALKRLQAKTAAELDALLPVIYHLLAA
jgi:hypothetical protein